jgi:ribokinase
MLVVFGSINMDVVMRVGTLPAPGETVMGHDYALKPGGKGANQAVAAGRDSADVHFVGALNDDSFGIALMKELIAEGIEHHIAASSQTTGCAIVMVGDDAENQIVVAPGANADLRHHAVPQDWLTPDTTVLMQREVSPAENVALAQRAKQAGATTILNLAPAPGTEIEDLKNFDYLVVNQGEAGQLAAALGLQKEVNPFEIIKKLSHKTQAAIIMTLGKDGALGVEKNGTDVHHVKAMAVDVVDTTGAGDTFTGVFAGAIDGGATMPQAMHRAPIASALACTALGAQSAMPRTDIINEYAGKHPMPVLTKSSVFSPARSRKP